jgi:glycine cleavage system H protein
LPDPEILKHLRYTPSHEWVKMEGNIATVGITNYAQKELGEIVNVELPKLHAKLKMGEEACVLESTKAAADVYAPIAGTVIEINTAVKADPTLINKKAEGTWLFKLEVKDKKELDYLLTLEKYKELVG